MWRIPVDSEAIHSIGYRGSVLEVEFEQGSVYQYEGVSEELYKELLDADSKGHFFMEYIRDRFPYRLIRRAS
jgi:hypothetical protein